MAARCKWVLATLCGVSLVVAAVLCTDAGAGNVNPGAQALASAPCAQCHDEEPMLIDSKGGKHKTAVACWDCHTEHPPKGKQAVPACSRCHSGKEHYKLDNCKGCHSNTHAPLDMTLSSDLTKPCLTCHAPQGEELKAHPSAHTNLACTECHTKHREIPSCENCHGKHTEDMDYPSCTTCHPVHQPKEVAYGKDTPSRYCASCHKKAMDLLNANTTKHRDLSCVFCHRDRHKAVPPCYACHGAPHPEQMLKKFKDCGECHSTAHDLRGK